MAYQVLRTEATNEIRSANLDSPVPLSSRVLLVAGENKPRMNFELPSVRDWILGVCDSSCCVAGIILEKNMGIVIAKENKGREKEESDWKMKVREKH